MSDSLRPPVGDAVNPTVGGSPAPPESLTASPTGVRTASSPASPVAAGADDAGPTGGQEELLVVDGISLSFGGVNALQDISFTVHRDESFAIIGPNGAGKSSLLNVLTGVYKPSSGSARINGQELVGRPRHAIAGLGVSRTFQNLGLFESMTVLDNVMVGRSPRLRRGILAGSLWWGPSRREETAARAHCLDILDLLGLADLWQTPLAGLPYGTKKRVELAKALASGPSVLLLDEPVAGMNPEESARLAGSVRLARSELGASILLIEHDLTLVMSMADTIMVMDFGRIVTIGPPSQIQSDPAVLKAYTGELDPTEVAAHERSPETEGGRPPADPVPGSAGRVSPHDQGERGVVEQLPSQPDGGDR